LGEDVIIMDEITLKAQPRAVTGKQVRQLRRQGLIPAVVYGHRTEPIALQVEERALRQLLHRFGGNQLIRLEIGDGGAPRMVLVREVQREPIKRRLLHVDLYQVVMTERVRAEVPVVLTGTSPAIESGKGLLQHGAQTVQIECLPADLIPQIEIDLSQLTEVDQAIAVGDLTLSDRCEILSDPDQVLVRILPVQAQVIEEEEALAVEAEAEIEVIKRERAAEQREEEGGE
jgi:large subunit ribosomal protein L25